MRELDQRALFAVHKREGIGRVFCGRLFEKRICKRLLAEVKKRRKFGASTDAAFRYAF